MKLEEIKVKVNKVKLSKKKTNIVAILKSYITSDDYNKVIIRNCNLSKVMN